MLAKKYRGPSANPSSTVIWAQNSSTSKFSIFGALINPCALHVENGTHGEDAESKGKGNSLCYHQVFKRVRFFTQG